MSKLNPRDWEWTTESILYYRPEAVDYFLGTFLAFFVGGLVSVFIGAGLDVFIPGWLATLVWIVLWAIASTHMLWVPRINRWRKVDNRPMLNLARRYRSLPKRDRDEFFPRNFEKMVKQYDLLDNSQCVALHNKTRDTLEQLDRRDAVINSAKVDQKRESFDLEDFFDEMDQGRRYAEIEAATLKEFL